MTDQKNFNWGIVGLDFGNWSEQKVWALNLPVTDIPMQVLLWHFDVPFWHHDNGEQRSITAWDVIKKTQGSTIEQARVEKADTSYPIDIMDNKGKWLVLDGLHRLIKLYQEGHKVVKVRVIPRERLPEILIDEPIEL